MSSRFHAKLSHSFAVRRSPWGPGRADQVYNAMHGGPAAVSEDWDRGVTFHDFKASKVARPFAL